MRFKTFIKRNKLLILSVIAAGIGLGVYNSSRATQPDITTAKSLELTGRIEGSETRLSTTVPARVKSVFAQEGEVVSPKGLYIGRFGHFERTD